MWPEDGRDGCEAVEWGHEEDDCLIMLGSTYDLGLEVFIVKVGEVESDVDGADDDCEDREEDCEPHVD